MKCSIYAFDTGNRFLTACAYFESLLGAYEGDLDLHVQSPDDLVAQLAKVECEA